MKQNTYFKTFLNGLLYENPSFVLFLGMCPTLAVTTGVVNAIGMGLSTTAVLICSNIVISLLRKFIPDKIRIAAYIVIIAGFVTVVQMLMNAYVPALSSSLGIYIPLIVVNCLILARAESFASKNTPLPSIVDGFANGLGYMVAIVILAFFRELIGSGKLLGYTVLPGFNPMKLFAMPPGAFIILGLMIFALNAIKQRKEA